MVAVASRGTFEEGLVLLWAMEKVRVCPKENERRCKPSTFCHLQLYLDSWTFASKHLPSPPPSTSEPGPTRALLSLIPNWSSPEFEKFVLDISELVDELDIEAGSDLAKRIAEVWKTTLWFEERFWQAGGMS